MSRQRHLLMIFLLESTALGFGSASAGAGLGLGLIKLFSRGVSFPASGVSGELVIYPHVDAPFSAPLSLSPSSSQS